MKTANLYKCKGGYAWDANYPMGGVDLINAAQQAKTSTDKPFIPLGRRTLHERALDSYSEINKLQGVTCEDDIWNCVVRKKKPVLVEYRKTLGQRVKEWFTEVVEDECV